MASSIPLVPGSSSGVKPPVVMPANPVVHLEFTLHGITHVPPALDESAGKGDVNRDVTTRYSGMHDHGKLPQLKDRGPLVGVLADLESAKQASDAFLTSLMTAEAAAAAATAAAAAAAQADEDAKAAKTAESSADGVGSGADSDAEVDQHAPTEAARRHAGGECV